MLSRRAVEFINKMCCIYCRSDLVLKTGKLMCTSCGKEYPIVDGIPILLARDSRTSQSGNSLSHTLLEKFFNFPNVYKLKTQLLLKINRTRDIDINNYIRDKNILDVGCGPYNYAYDNKFPKSKIGLDLSLPFIRHAQNVDPSGFYLIASALKIPFKDKTFDVTLIFHLLHHIPAEELFVLKEVARVTTDFIILVEPLQSEKGIPRLLKSTWWKLADGRRKYNTYMEWKSILGGFEVVEELRTGNFFENMYKCVISLKSKSSA